MPPRPPACTRAVQRQLFKSSDSTCPFDDVSGNSCRRFASSVPGPLESRRRLGKRRLTQVSDSFTSTYPGSLWSLFPDVGGIKWEWHAPSDRARAKKQDNTTPLLPSWLLGLGNTSQREDAQFEVDNVAEPGQSSNEPSLESDIQGLRESIRSASHPWKPDQLVESFLPLVKQNLSLGLVSGNMLDAVLRGVTQDFRNASIQWNSCPNQTLFKLYASCWEGMISCKVLRPEDFEGKVIDTLLTSLACLPFNEKMQDLATCILQATSQTQHIEMELGIKAVVTAWSQNWLAKEFSGNCQQDLKAAETTILEIGDSLDITRNSIVILEGNPNSNEAILQAKRALSRSRFSLSLAEMAIRRVDDIIWPLRKSARKLATALEHLPTSLLSSTVLSCSNHIISMHVNEENPTKLRYHWLFTISHLTNAGDQLFLESWKKLEVTGSPFSEMQCCHLVLSRWASQGLVTRLFEVEISFVSSNLQDLAALLFSINKWHQNYLRKTRNLFFLLESLGKLNMVYRLLSRLRSLGLKLPITQLRSLLEAMSTHDTKATLKIYGLHHDLLIDYRRFSTNFLRQFVSTLIKDTNINPGRLLWYLGIPSYGSRPRHQRNFTPRLLRKQTVELLNIIALEFARCEARSTRVALRNVLQCLYHLRLNNVPIPLELSLAISHSGITREIRNNQFVGQERLRYVISIIEEVEGKKVANLVDTMVFKWREYLSEKSARERREGNVLLVGPID